MGSSFVSHGRAVVKTVGFITTWMMLCAALLLGGIMPGMAESGTMTTVTHRVGSGDTIRGILTRHNCISSMGSYSQLRDEFARLNPGLPHSSALVAGQDIQVPHGAVGGACLRADLTRVVRVEFETGATSEKVRVYLDGPVLPDLFMLKNQTPHRLVCDFDETLPRENMRREISTQGRLIRKIRVGHEDKPFRRARIVLELADTLAGRVDQLFFEQESLFVLTVHEAF